LLSGAGTGLAALALSPLQHALAFSLEQGVAQPALASVVLALVQHPLASFFSTAGAAASDLAVTTFSVDFFAGAFCALTVDTAKAKVSATTENRIANFFIEDWR